MYVGTSFSVLSGRRGLYRTGTGLAWHHPLDDVSGGGVCLCLLQALAAGPLPLAVAAALGAAGVSGLELAVGAVCRRLCIFAVWDYADEWGNLAGLVCPRYTFYWFLLCGGSFSCYGALKVPFIIPQKSVQKS